MLNLSDNELDNLSREAAEKFEPGENAQSWNKLEQLLDNNLGKPTPIPETIRPGTILMYSGAILIAASVTYFLFKSKKNNQNSTPQVSTITNQKPSAGDHAGRDKNTVVLSNKNQSQSQTKANQKIANHQASAADNPDAIVSDSRRSQKPDDNDKKINQPSSIKNNPGSVSKSIGFNNKSEKAAGSEPRDRNQETNGHAKGKFDKPGNIKNDAGNIDRTGETGSQKDLAGASSKEKRNPLGKDKFSDAGVSTEKDLFQHNSNQKDFASSGNQHRRRNTGANERNKSSNGMASIEKTTGSVSSNTDERNDELKFAAIPGVQSVGGEPLFFINDSAIRSFKPANKMAAMVNPGKHKSHGAFINQSLQIGILFAPEFSEVKHIYQNNRIGNNLGITLSYQLFSKVSINSGIIFSKKYYQANQQGFHAPAGAVVNGFDLKFVNATANVIDIPLNIRYNYFSDETTIFFVNGGFSSYLMSKQDLKLYCQPNNTISNYALQYPSGWIPSQIPPSDKNYLFSILNLSAGFETSLGNNFSFQFEPYMKLPIQGVGFGKVDLNSYGINFSLKYAPVLKRGRR